MKINILFILLLISIEINAQYFVKGCVTDSVGTPLPKSGKCFSSEFANEFNFNLTGVRFANFEYGWYCTKYACTGSYAKDLTLYANKYGIYIPMATHGLKIEGVHCHYNMTALYLPTGGT